MIAAPDKFVPLAASSARGKREEFRVLVAESPEKARSLRELTPVPVEAAGKQPTHKSCEPRVTLQRDGDCITGIQVQCSCGEIIHLKCGYELPAAPPPTA